jgi:sortase (surface protein transpeptidase)
MMEWIITYYWIRQHFSRLVIVLSVGTVLAAYFITSINLHKLFSDRQVVYRMSRVFMLVGVSFMLVGFLSSVSIWQANAAANSRASKLVVSANHRDANPAKKPPASPASTAVVPSTTKPTTSYVNSYSVPADQPRLLIIPKLGVSSRVLSLGTDSTGAIATPSNVFDTAWYNQSAKPGTPGAALIDGHISSWTSHGVFFGLRSLVPGDLVEVQLGNGTTLSYKVAATQIYDANNVDMNAALSPAQANTSGLNLITCGGSVIPGTNEFSQRTIVFTEQV